MSSRIPLALLVAVALCACDGPSVIPPVDSSTPDPDAGPETDGGLPRVDSGTDAGPAPAALVRFVHAAPGIATVDFRDAGRIVSFDVYYRAATPYERVQPGSHALSVTDADTPEGEPIATSGEHTFEDGARYLALLVDPPDQDPQLMVLEESEPSGTDPFVVRVLNATYDTASLDVDLDGATREPEVDGLAAGALSDWIALDAAALRPTVTTPSTSEPFTITDTVAPWVTDVDRALVVVVGRPVEALPSAVEGLSILLVLEATESASTFFVLRPDPRLAILQASPDLAPASITLTPSSAFEGIPVADAIEYGQLVEATVPPGHSYVEFRPDGVLWGPQVNADLLPGHRYLMITHGHPDHWGDDRFSATVLRDALAGDAFVITNASPDTPGAIRWYGETSPDTWTVLDAVSPMAFHEHTPSRGVALDATARLGVAREDRSAPNVWLDAPSTPGTRGFLVLAGSYFADLAAPNALAAFWVWAPVDDRWSVERVSPGAGSGPLPDETPPVF